MSWSWTMSVWTVPDIGDSPVHAAPTGVRPGSYRSAQGFSRPRIRSVISMPAMLPCVVPMPESPVAT